MDDWELVVTRAELEAYTKPLPGQEPQVYNWHQDKPPGEGWEPIGTHVLQAWDRSECKDGYTYADVLITWRRRKGET